MSIHTPINKTSGALLMAVVCVLAVVTSLNAQDSFKVDDSPELRCDLSEVAQVTDSPSPIFVALDKNKDAKAAIIVYGLEGTSLRYARYIKEWMSGARAIDPDRLIYIYGGKSETLRLELWLIPPNALSPKTSAQDDNETSTLFDQYGYWRGEYCGSERAPALIQFGEMLRKRPGWRGYILIRPHRNGPAVRAGDADWDPDGYVSHQQAERRGSRDKRLIVRKLGISPSRIKAVVGTDDTWSHTELWLVPPGAAPPSAKMKGSSQRK